MKKTITVDGHPVELNSSAGWFYDYREEFGHDIMPDLLPVLEALLGTLAELQENAGDELVLTDDVVQKIIDALATAEITTVFNITWAMAHNADDKIARPREWMNSFDNFPVDEVVPQLVTLILESSVSTKNATSLLQRVKGLNPST